MKKYIPFADILICILRVGSHVSCRNQSVARRFPKENRLSSADMRSDGDFLIGVSEAELLVYPAENPNGTAIMMCPGGGYYGLAMGHEGKDIPWLNDMGITYAILKYRMPNGHHEVPSLTRSRPCEF